MSTHPSWAHCVTRHPAGHSDKQEGGWRQPGAGGDPGTARTQPGGGPGHVPPGSPQAGVAERDAEDTAGEWWGAATGRPRDTREGPRRGPWVNAVSQQQPRAGGSARVRPMHTGLCSRVCALQQSMCLLGIKTVRKRNEGSAWEHTGLRSPVQHQEGLCSGTGSGAASCLFPGRFSKFPRNSTLWGGGGGLFHFPKKHVHKTGTRK